MGDCGGGLPTAGYTSRIPPNDLVKFENNSKARNILISALGRKKYATISHLKTAHAIWKKLCDYNEGTNEIKSCI